MRLAFVPRRACNCSNGVAHEAYGSLQKREHKKTKNNNNKTRRNRGTNKRWTPEKSKRNCPRVYVHGKGQLWFEPHRHGIVVAMDSTVVVANIAVVIIAVT